MKTIFLRYTPVAIFNISVNYLHLYECIVWICVYVYVNVCIYVKPINQNINSTWMELYHYLDIEWRLPLLGIHLQPSYILVQSICIDKVVIFYLYIADNSILLALKVWYYKCQSKTKKLLYILKWRPPLGQFLLPSLFSI